MKLNQTERTLVTSKARQSLQTNIESRLLMRLFADGVPLVENALEIGCGGGQGVQFLRQRLGASTITAVDLDKDMLSLARERLGKVSWATFIEADVCKLPFDNGAFDMVAEFAMLHHVPDWQGGINEIARVIKPGGHFLFWDLYRAAIVNPLSKRLFDHPLENRFNHGELLTELEKNGLKVIKSSSVPGLFGMGLCRKG